MGNMRSIIAYATIYAWMVRKGYPDTMMEVLRDQMRWARLEYRNNGGTNDF